MPPNVLCNRLFRGIPFVFLLATLLLHLNDRIAVNAFTTTMPRHSTRTNNVVLSAKKNKNRSKNSSPSLYESHHSVPTIKPKLLVFDLDNTIWTPELYQIRQRQVPRVNQDIWLFEDAKLILNHLVADEWSDDVKLGIASRTHKGDWARTLLSQFTLNDNTSLEKLFPFTEIIKGSKRVHFERLRQSTGVAYEDMLFFDDDARMNLGEVSQMGVLCCHTPRGLTADLFRASLEKYQQLKEKDQNAWMGHVLNAANLNVQVETNNDLADEGRETTGRVKFFSQAKRFGFVVENGGSGKEYFFHESKVADGLQVQTGMVVRFETATDGQGRPSAVILESQSSNNGKNNNVATVEMPCFSMSQPFAALLLNGVKTIETRNNPMLLGVKPGTRVLLHCGQRDWNDLEAPQRKLRQVGFDKKEITTLSALPDGFTKGNIVGIMTVGETYESTPKQRETAELQQKVVADADGIGRYCTPIVDATWLKQPVKARGNRGLYTARIPKSVLPKGYNTEAPTIRNNKYVAKQSDTKNDNASSNTMQETKPKMWTISG